MKITIELPESIAKMVMETAKKKGFKMTQNDLEGFLENDIVEAYTNTIFESESQLIDALEAYNS
jgi:3-hydroxyacyl-CoA dehydrogenase